MMTNQLTQILQMMLARNPNADQAMRMIRGKNMKQLRITAENMCQERGTSIERVAQRMGLPLPGSYK